MVKRNVFYVVKVENNIAAEPIVAFYDKKTAEEYINKNNLPYYNGCNGYKIEEGEEKKSVKAYTSYEEYRKNDKNEKIKELYRQIKEIEAEKE